MVMTRRSARIISRNTCASMLIAMVLWNNAYAAKAPTEDSLWYYEIGGAEPVSAPANPSVVSVTLGGSAAAASVTAGSAAAGTEVQGD